MTAREYLDKIYGTEGIDGSEFTIPLDSAAHHMESYMREVEKLPMHGVMWRSGQPCNCAKNDYLTIVDGECICGTCGGTVLLQGCT